MNLNIIPSLGLQNRSNYCTFCGERNGFKTKPKCPPNYLKLLMSLGRLMSHVNKSFELFRMNLFSSKQSPITYQTTIAK